MRHRHDRRQLGRNSSHRRAMFRNMATSLFLHQRIKTTHAKAKELRRVVEKLITLGKRYGALGPAGEDKTIAAKKLHLHRQALAYLKDKKAVERILEELPTRYSERNGGYTRIIKLGLRAGDAAPMAFLELLAEEEAPVVKEKRRRRRRKSKAVDETKVSGKEATGKETQKDPRDPASPGVGEEKESAPSAVETAEPPESETSPPTSNGSEGETGDDAAEGESKDE